MPLPLEQFLKWEKENPDRIFLRQPIHGVWKTWTWAQAGNEARRIANGFLSLGLKEGDHIAILSKNCAQWIIADVAIMMAGCISIPIYPTLSAAAIEPILVHSEAKAIIIGKLDDFKSQANGIPENMIRIGVKAFGINEQHSIEELINKNEPLNILYSWKNEEILTIIYTSGTTGKSKGVMHTAGSFLAVITAAIPQLELPHQPVMISYLPLSHIAEKVGIELYALFTCGTISFAESLETFSKNLAEIQPNIFFAVPRIWQKMREGILSKLSQRKLDIILSIPFVNSFFKKSLKKKMGFSRVSHFYSAAAPISVELQQWYEKLGIIIYQAYGMTEDCVYSHFCGPKANKFGTAGKVLPGVQVKIADDGEIRVKSEGNMKGYYKEPQMTTEAFDEENYLKTGDMGEYDNEGFLKITGRVKDQFKTDKGKFISPAPIEVKLLSDTDIEHTCIVGTGVPQPMALVCLSEAGKRKVKDELIKNFTESLEVINHSLEKFEKIEKVVIMKEPWTIANNMITPSLKVKRNEIEKIHLPKYPAWYDKPGLVVWE
ncbi:MAG TPA: AMP-binding protein [Chitinophagaceae bacterium]|nr:AMP-binding protein [Chitinophagaceae bacterium]